MTEDALSGGLEDGAGPVVSMLDVLEDSEALESDAAAVLGPTSDTVCTFSQGAVPRQPLYAVGVGERLGGVCLACSLHCWEGAALVELYTKRNFTCDCGTPRLANRCKLQQEGGGGTSRSNNTANHYNQNFRGLYCSCARPYPDPEYPDDEDCMVQCVLCEDWFHGKHLGTPNGPPEDDKYAEMICIGCVSKHPFLLNYQHLQVSSKEGSEKKEATDKEGEDHEKENVDIESGSLSESKNTGPVCKLKPGGASSSPSDACSLFLPLSWRQELCLCQDCLQLYKQQGIQFIASMEDTVQHYESQGAERPGMIEKGMEALGQMDRVKQVEAIQSYNNMKENLMEYLSKFRDTNKVVREEDIREFFEQMKSNKKRRFEGPPPDSCK